MQLAFALGTGNRLLETHRTLLETFGPVPACLRLDPVSQMIFAMLSGRTRDEIAMAIFTILQERLDGRWEDLITTRHSALLKLIGSVTFAERKVIFLPAAVKAILARRGNLDLDFLAAWPVVDAQSWLEALPGVGPKTSAAVLNFSTLHRRILMVDTAHVRVARRLGFVPEKAGLSRATRILNRQIPDDWTAGDTEEHHVLMQRLGKQTCTHSGPHCPGCPLKTACPSALSGCR